MCEAMNYQHYQFVQRTCSRRRFLFVIRINTNLQKSAHACIFCLPFSNCLYDDPLAPWNTFIVNLICTLNALYLRVHARSHSQNVTVATGTCQCSVLLSPRPIRQHCTFTITPPTVSLYHCSCTPVQLFTSVHNRQGCKPLYPRVEMFLCGGSSHILNHESRFSIK